jgi:hypothetical protein
LIEGFSERNDSRSLSSLLFGMDDSVIEFVGLMEEDFFFFLGLVVSGTEFVSS